MILLRKYRFWSRAAATVCCDGEGCRKAGAVDLVVQPTGGFAVKIEQQGYWHVAMNRENPGQPFRTFCPNHKPTIERISPEVVAETKRLIDVVRR